MSEELMQAVKLIQQQNDLIMKRLDFLDSQISNLRNPLYNPLPNRSIERTPITQPPLTPYVGDPPNPYPWWGQVTCSTHPNTAEVQE